MCIELCLQNEKNRRDIAVLRLVDVVHHQPTHKNRHAKLHSRLMIVEQNRQIVNTTKRRTMIVILVIVVEVHQTIEIAIETVAQDHQMPWLSKPLNQ